MGLGKEAPVVLRGLKEGTDEWNQINLTFRDVLIYNVAIHQRGVPGNYSLRGSAFVFEMDGLCILHSGDVSEPFNEDQLQLIGHVDILLQTIGGVYTIGPEGDKKIIEQLLEKRYLKVIGGKYPVLCLTPQGEAVIRNKLAIPLILPRQTSNQGIESEKARRQAGGTLQYTEQLLSEGLSVEQIAARRGL